MEEEYGGMNERGVLLGIGRNDRERGGLGREEREEEGRRGKSDGGEENDKPNLLPISQVISPPHPKYTTSPSLHNMIQNTAYYNLKIKMTHKTFKSVNLLVK